MALEPGADGQHITYCRLCEAQCGLIAEVKDGRIVHVGPDRDHPVSRGHLCVKGPGMVNVTYDKDRILSPMKRMGGLGDFAPVSWDEAISDIAERVDTITKRHGGDALGAYIGNPAAFSTMHYAYGYAFIQSFGSNKRYNAMQVDTGARVLASDQVFGNGHVYPFPDILDCDHLMIFGGNPVVSKMSLICAPRAMQHLDGIAKRGSVIVVDPRNTETAKRYEHQPIAPDSDAWLLAGMLKVMIDEGLVETEFLAERVVGWEKLFDRLRNLELETVQTKTGIDTARVQELARRFASARTAACYGRVGSNRGSFSTLANILMDAINLATGNFGRDGGSLIGIAPFEPKDSSYVAPGYGESRSRIGDLPLVSGVQPGGTLADDILVPGDGQMRALFVDCGNPVLSYPDGEKTERALESLDLFVSLDFYMNESARYAHYILPTTTFFERADINDLWSPNAPEPWLHYVQPVIEPLGEARHEFDIYSSILSHLGRPNPASMLMGTEPSEGQSEPTHLDLVDAALRIGPFGDGFGANPDGLTLERLQREFPHGKKLADRMPSDRSWDRVALDEKKPRLWTDLIEAELGRLEAHSASADPAALKLFGRRLLHGMNSWLHNSDRVIRNSKPTLLMHPDDARDRQITDGKSVRIRSKTASVDVTVEITTDVVPGAVCYPHGFGHKGGWQKANELDGANINLLASSDPKDFEPVSGNCLLDGIPVEVTPLQDAV